MTETAQTKLARALGKDMAAKTATEPPPAEKLRAYLDGRLDEAEANDIRRRLLDDDRRVHDLLALDKAPVLSADEPAPPMAEADIERAWADLEQRYRQSPDEPEPAVKGRVNWQTHALWLAACLLIGAWGFSRTPSLPRMLVAGETVALHLGEGVTRATPVHLAGSESISLNLSIPNRFRQFPYYQIEFVSGEEIIYSQRNTGLRANLSLYLQPSFFPKSGPYRLRIHGESDGQLTLLGSFDFEVVDQ